MLLEHAGEAIPALALRLGEMPLPPSLLASCHSHT